MPTYTGICPICGKRDFYSKIEDRDNLVCSGTKEEPHESTKAERQFDAPMVGAMGLTGGSFSFVSPIDGSTVQGKSEYYAHMQKHNVVPESEMRGQAEHVQKRKAAERKAEIRKAAEGALRAHKNQ